MYQYYSTTKPRTSKPIHTMVDLESRSIYTRVRIERKGARFIAHSGTQNPISPTRTSSTWIATCEKPVAYTRPSTCHPLVHRRTVRQSPAAARCRALCRKGRRGCSRGSGVSGRRRRPQQISIRNWVVEGVFCSKGRAIPIYCSSRHSSRYVARSADPCSLRGIFRDVVFKGK